METAKVDPDFITVTCLEWKHVLADERIKDIIIGSLRFLSNEKRINVFAFVIMNNHIHIIWQLRGNHRRENVQRDFLKYTGQRILGLLREFRSPLLDDLRVAAKDRKYQVWERDALSIPLYSDKFFMQKLNYIHNNPVRAGLCKYPEDYYYSSAAFYYKNVANFDFLVHFEG
jgi:REP element-mobilizing transposase RayT